MLVATIAVAAISADAFADVVTPWGGRGSTVVQCMPYSHTMTTNVTITPDIDMVYQGGKYYLAFEKWNGSSFVGVFADIVDFWASSVPVIRTYVMTPGYYRVRVVYQWSGGGTVRAQGVELISSYLQYGTTYWTAKLGGSSANFCQV
jgi:hypothetical protein